jgi:release factor glutamine methyltransferase
VILSDWLKSTPAILERAGVEAPKSELYLWLALVTGKNRAYFNSRAGEAMEGFLSRDNIRHLEDILLRRLEREPLAYILGTTCFWGNTIHVGPGVLIPRADSETAVEVVLSILGYVKMPWNQCYTESYTPLPFEKKTDGIIRFMDLCTGSGCIGISIALDIMGKNGQVSGVLTDISDDAIYYAKGNIYAHGLREILTLCRCDLFPGQSTVFGLWGDKKASIIVANPPYITASDMETLMPEVMDYEPELALSGGDDGLVFFRRILRGSHTFLVPGGWLVFEHGYDQGESVPALCRENGYTNVMSFHDYGGQPRVTIAQNGSDISSIGDQ